MYCFTFIAESGRSVSRVIRMDKENGWDLNFVADFGTTDISIAGGKDIFITKLIMLPSIFDGYDFNGNGSSDVSVFRPSNGRWFIKSIGGHVWGMLGDIPLVR